MPMPKLDSMQYVPVMPVDPSHKVPRKDGLRFFSQDPANPDTADLFDPYDAQLLAGGSLRRACEVETADARASAEAAAENAAAEAQAAADRAARDAKPDTVKPDPVKPPVSRADGAPAA